MWWWDLWNIGMTVIVGLCAGFVFLRPMCVARWLVLSLLGPVFFLVLLYSFVLIFLVAAHLDERPFKQWSLDLRVILDRFYDFIRYIFNYYSSRKQNPTQISSFVTWVSKCVTTTFTACWGSRRSIPISSPSRSHVFLSKIPTYCRIHTICPWRSNASPCGWIPG